MLRTSVFALAMASALSAQSQCLDFSIGTDLSLTDDSTAQGLPLGFTFTYGGVSYTDICVCSNGYIVLGATTTLGSDFSPTEAELLSGPARICPLWMDFNPGATGSGHVYYQTFPGTPSTPARAMVTWAGVYEFSTTNPVDLQIEFDANGTIRVGYGTNPTTRTVNKIIGASTGGGAASNPVSFASLPLQVAQDTFAQVITGVPTMARQMLWLPTTPGFLIADVPCVPTALPAPAKTQVVGVGCPGRTMPSLYEVFDAANVPDLSNLDFTFLPNGLGGYLVLPGVAGPMFTGLSSNLGAGDDTTHAVTLPFAFPHAYSTVNDIVVSSNGFLTLGTVNPGSGCCSGSVATLLGGESRIAAYWSDLNATGAGVYADLDPTSGEFCITWSNVFEYSTSTVNTFQIALDPTGMFKIRFGTVARVSHTFLTGYSYGHGAQDPGRTDLSAMAVGDTGILSFIEPLTQAAAASNRPVIGTTFQVDVGNISPAPNGNVAILVIGFTELSPAVDLAALGAPGCNAYLLPGSSDIPFVGLPAGAPSFGFPISIPNLPILIGLQAMSQAVSDDVGANGLGLKFSNGLRWSVSSL